MDSDLLKELVENLPLVTPLQMSLPLDSLSLQKCDITDYSLFFDAVERGHTALVNMLIVAGVDVNLTTASGDNALHLAIRADQHGILTSLLKAGADIDSCNENCETPLFLACKLGNVSTTKCLLHAGADVETANSKGETPLIQASKYGRTPVVEELLLAGADIEAENIHGETASMKACQFAKIETVQCLLHHGADVNHMSYDMNTPLLQAVRSTNRSDICRQLISFGAHVNTVNEDGSNALIIAAKYNRPEVVQFLIESGSSLNHRNQNMQSALWYSVCHSLTSCSPCLMSLLRAGVKINHELHCAVGYGLIKVVKTMLTFGASPTMISTAKLGIRPPPPMKMVSPLCMALLTQSVDIARYLLKIGFLTQYDLYVLPRDSVLREYLKDSGKRESLYILSTELSQPLPLATLSLAAVSRAIGFKPQTRRTRVGGTGLPPLFQRRLLFE